VTWTLERDEERRLRVFSRALRIWRLLQWVTDELAIAVLPDGFVHIPGQMNAAWRAIESLNDSPISGVPEDPAATNSNADPHLAIEPLICDPLAAVMAGEICMRRAREGLRGQKAIAMAKERDLVLIRTKFFDDFLVRTVNRWPGHGTIQVVLLGTGMDTRPYRCSLTNGERSVVVFELERRETLARKMEQLTSVQARPRCTSVVPIPWELRANGDDNTWRGLMLSSGFVPEKPSIWVIEKLFNHCSSVEVVRVMRNIRDMSARGSVICLSAPTPSARNRSLDATARDHQSGTGSIRGRSDPSTRITPKRKPPSSQWTCGDPEYFEQFGFRVRSSTRAGSAHASYGRWPGKKEGLTLYVELGRQPRKSFGPAKHVRDVAESQSPIQLDGKMEIIDHFLQSMATPDVVLTTGEDVKSDANTPIELKPDLEIPPAVQHEDSEVVGKTVVPQDVKSLNLMSPNVEPTVLTCVLTMNSSVIRGGTVRVCGNVDALGNWNPAAAPVIDANVPEGSQVMIDTRVDFMLQYKFVVLYGDEDACWEAGPNRQVYCRQGACTVVYHVWRV